MSGHTWVRHTVRHKDESRLFSKWFMGTCRRCFCDANMVHIQFLMMFMWSCGQLVDN